MPTVHVYVTGFGRFAGVETNPTSLTVPTLEGVTTPLTVGEGEEWLAAVAHAGVMEVATGPCDEALAAIASAARTALTASPRDRALIVNFGVAAGAPRPALEAAAYNAADFRVADMAGVQLRGVPIDDSRPLGGPRHTGLNVQRLAADVAAATGLAVDASTDPGRFLCNWAYYRTLSHVEAINASWPGAAAGLFVHVPSQTTLPLEDQRKLAVAVVTAAAQALAAGSVSSTAASANSSAAVESRPDDAFAASVVSLVKDGDFAGAEALQALSRAWEEALLGSRTQAAACVGAMGFPSALVDTVLDSLCSDARAAFRAWASGASSSSSFSSSPPPPPLVDADLAAALVVAAAEEAPPTPAPTPAPAPAPSPYYKLVVAVRDDLGMGKGKVAAQVAHAALKAYRRSNKDVLRAWEAQGEPIVVVKANDAAHLRALATTADAAGVLCSPIRDAGRTQVDPGTVTVMAVGPALGHQVDAVTGGLKLL